MSAKVYNTPAMMDAFERIAQERHRQNTLVVEGKIPFNCSTRHIHNALKLAVLTKEVGEVAKEINEGTVHADVTTRRRERLKTELVQVAAVAVAWLESLETKEGK